LFYSHFCIFVSLCFKKQRHNNPSAFVSLYLCVSKSNGTTTLPPLFLCIFVFQKATAQQPVHLCFFVSLCFKKNRPPLYLCIFVFQKKTAHLCIFVSLCFKKQRHNNPSAFVALYLCVSKKNRPPLFLCIFVFQTKPVSQYPSLCNACRAFLFPLLAAFLYHKTASFTLAVKPPSPFSYIKPTAYSASSLFSRANL
jgi:hypothetical protein